MDFYCEQIFIVENLDFYHIFIYPVTNVTSAVRVLIYSWDDLSTFDWFGAHTQR